MDRVIENVIEWITGDDTATVTLSQRKYVNRIKKMAEKHPQMAVLDHENEDGSIVAHISLKALHLTVFGSKNKPPNGGSEYNDAEE